MATIFLINESFETVKASVNFPCRIARFKEDQCVITTHYDHRKMVKQLFDVVDSCSTEGLDFDYTVRDWVMIGLGNPAHLQHSVETEFATFTDGEYCLSVRGEKIYLPSKGK
jgi:hypothetical protein